MNFTALSEEEIQEQSLIKEGSYKYQVIQSEERYKNGNPYISMLVRVFTEHGEPCIYTVLTPSFVKLIKHFCDVNGLEDQYKSGSLTPEMVMNKCSGRVVVGVQGEKPNPNGGMYPAKNIVKDYVVDGLPSKIMPLKNDFINDEIPF